jgi:hypothetical protein
LFDANSAIGKTKKKLAILAGMLKMKSQKKAASSQFGLKSASQPETAIFIGSNTMPMSVS